MSDSGKDCKTEELEINDDLVRIKLRKLSLELAEKIHKIYDPLSILRSEVFVGKVSDLVFKELMEFLDVKYH